MARNGSTTTETEVADVRNVVLVGPPGTGKSILAESMLYLTGLVNRLGTVSDGTTICDFEDIEKRLGHSVSMTVASTTVRDAQLLGSRPDIRLNIIDTPGHADFIGELRAGLRAADSAVFVISAVDGVDGATRLLWRECAAVGMPRAVVITHVDQPRGDFAAALAQCQSSFGNGVQPLYLPSAAGLLGLLSGSLYELGDDPRHRAAAQGRHRRAGLVRAGAGGPDRGHHHRIGRRFAAGPLPGRRGGGFRHARRTTWKRLSPAALSTRCCRRYRPPAWG